MAETIAAARPQARGGMLLTLAILSLLLFGPLTGVPAWLMANQDIREIRDGHLTDPRGLAGVAKVVAIVGTFCSPLWLIFLFAIVEVALMVTAALFSFF